MGGKGRLRNTKHIVREIFIYTHLFLFVFFLIRERLSAKFFSWRREWVASFGIALENFCCFDALLPLVEVVEPLCDTLPPFTVSRTASTTTAAEVVHFHNFSVFPSI